MCFSCWITIAACFKNDQNKIRFFTDIDLLFKVKKGIKGGIFHSVYRYVKANNKNMEDYDKKRIIMSSYWDGNNLHGKANSKKLPANNFDWIEDISKFNKDFKKNYNEESAEVLEVDVKYLGKLHKLT